MSSQNQNLIIKGFSTNSTTNTQHIAEFTAQYDGGVFPEGSDKHLGILFSVQNDQNFEFGNHVGSMMLVPTIAADGYVSSSQLKFYLKDSAANSSAELSEAFTIQPGSLQSESLTLDKSDGDVIFNLVSRTNTWTVGIDNSDNDAFKIHSGNGLPDTADFKIDTNGKVYITGGLEVTGEVITSTNTVIRDSLIELNNNTTGDNTSDCGIVIERGDLTNAFMGWDESADTFTVATTTATGGSSGNLTLTDADFRAAGVTCTSLSVSDAAAGLDIVFGGNTTLNKISLTDNLADALNITQGGNSYLKFVTTNSSEQIVVGKNSTFNGTTIADLGTVTTADIDGGSIDGTTIGANSAAAGTFTSVSVGDGNITNVGSIACDSVIVDDATAGLDIVFGGNTTLNKISLTDNLADALNITQGGNSYLKFVTTNSSEQIVVGKNSTFNGTTIADLGTVTTVDIDGGSIDGTTIGANSAAAGTFEALVGTSLSVSDGNITNVGSVACDSVIVDDAAAGLDIVFGGNTTLNKISLTDNLADALNINEGGNSYIKFVTTNGSEQVVVGKNSTFSGTTIADLGTVTTANIDGGSIDGTVIGANSAAAGTFEALVGTSLSVSDGNITNVGSVACDSVIVDDAAAGLDIVFGGNTTLNKISLTDNLADALNITQGGNSYLKFVTTNSSEQIVVGKNSTFNGTTIADLGTVTTADIDGGSIDGTTIGANSAAAGTFEALVGTSLSVSDGNITNVGSVACDSVIVDDAAAGLDILFGGNTTLNKISLTDNLADALNINEGGNSYIKFVTTNGSEQVVVGKNSTFSGTTIADLGTVTTADIDGGSIDGTVIGANSAAAGTFEALVGTSLSVSDGNITNVGSVACDSVIVDDAAAGLDIVFGGNTTLNKISLTDNLADALNINEGGNSYIKFVTTNGSEQVVVGKNSTFSGTTIADLGTVTTADIDGGSIDGTTIGANSAAAGTFEALVGTSLSVSDGNITNVGNIALDSISADDGSSFSFGSNWTAASRTCADLGTVTTANIDGGSIDGTIIGANSAAAGTFSSLSVSDGNITNVGNIALDSISADDGSSFSFGSNWTAASRTCADLGSVTTVDINGGSIDGTVIGANSAAAGTFSSLSVSDGNITNVGNIALDSISADDGSSFSFGSNWTAASRTCADLGTVTTANIDGGSIDGTIIGANSAAAGTFSSLSVSDGNITNVGNIALDSISADNGSSFSFGSNWTAASRTCADLGSVTTVDINGGSIDGTVIGANSAAAGTFSSLSVSDGNITNVGSVACDSVIVDDAAAGLDIVFGGNTTLNKISLTDNLADALNINEGGNSYIKFVTTNGSEQVVVGKNSTFSGTTIADLGTVTTVDIDGGSIDGTTIGANSAAAGTFEALVGTSLSVSDGNITNVGSVACDSVIVDDAAAGLDIVFGGNTTLNKISLTDNLADALNINEGGNSYIKFVTTNGSEQVVVGKNSTFSGTTIADLGTVTTANIDGGSIDGTVIGANSAAAGTFTSVSVGDGNITNVGSIACDSVIVDDATAGLDIVFGGNTTLNKISLTDNLADALNITQGGNSYLKFVTTNSSEQIVVGKNSTFSGTTIADLGTVTTVDIDGGSIDGTTIGANSAAAGTFEALVGTSLSVSDGNITNVGSVACDSVIVDDAAAGLDIVFGGNTTLNKISLTDNLADALNINEGGNSYIKFVTTNGSEQVVVGKNSTFSGTTIADLGTVTTANIDGGSIDGTTIGANSAAAGTFTSVTANAGINVKNGATDAGFINFYEDPDNGTNKLKLKSADNISSDFTVTLPSATTTLVGTGTTDTLTNKTLDGVTFNGTTTFTDGGTHDIPNLSKGAGIQYEATTFNDATTSANGTNTRFSLVNLVGPSLSAQNTGVLTTEAATLKISGAPTATGDNQTITTSLGLLVDSGNSHFKDDVNLGNSTTSNGVLRFYHGGNANTTAITPHPNGPTITYTLPSTVPSNNGDVLSSTTDGVLSWAAAGGGGGGGASNLDDLGDAYVNTDANFTNSLALGISSLGVLSWTNAARNVAIGVDAISALTTGDDNVCVGYNSAASLDTGSRNTFVGSISGSSSVSGTNTSQSVDNVCLGYNSAPSMTSGSRNTFVGSLSGSNVVGGTNNTVIGYDSRASAAGANNEVTLGNSSVQTLRCGATTIASLSDRRDKTDITDSTFGLDFLSKIRPVEFTWKRRELEAGDKDHPNNGVRRVGFIAQEFQEAMPNGENELLDLVHETNPERIEAKYGNLIPVLVKSIQDLQKKVEELEEKLNNQ